MALPQWGTPANHGRLLFLPEAVIHISPQPPLPRKKTNSHHSSFTHQPVSSCLPRETLFGRPNCQNTKSSLSLVQVFSPPPFLLLILLTSALKDFKLQGSLRGSYGRKLNPTGGCRGDGTSEEGQEHWVREFLSEADASPSPQQHQMMVLMQNQGGSFNMLMTLFNI